ncbi:uncharacterized protein LOC144009123 isoform X1 [Festucalex cinctus]
MGTELSRGAPGQHSPGHPSKKGSGAPAAICKATTIMEYCLHISCCPSTFTSTEDKSATCCEKAVWDTDGSALQPCNWKAAFPQIMCTNMSGQLNLCMLFHVLCQLQRARWRRCRANTQPYRLKT